MESIPIKTRSRDDFVDITGKVQDILGKQGVEEGLCVVFVPHTTAGVTINENADPDVVKDCKYLLDKLIAWDDRNYRHLEGNSAAHLKASLMGSSVSIPIANHRLVLGTWQGIYLCEFDGPRQRQVYCQVLGS